MTVESRAVPPPESYGKPPFRESSRGRAGAPTENQAIGHRKIEIQATEIWLRGNPRPVIGLSVAGLGVAIILGAGSVAAGGPAWLATAIGAAAVALIGVLAAGALQPRLTRRGATLVVRLQPLVAREVPLDIVECVFPGSQPVPTAGSASLGSPAGSLVGGQSGAAADRPPGTRRVGTLVIRLAERATEWRQRPTFSPWGTWEGGQIVIDGRWCEPLSPDFARRLGGRLIEAKRQAGALPPGASPAGTCSEAAAEPSA